MAKILVIDDTNDNLVVLKALLKDSFPDAVLLFATSGEQGYRLFLAERPDIVLLDIVMPGMDGYQVCRKIKKDPDLGYTPVVMITATKIDKESRIKSLEAGADGFLTKPIDESELTAQVRAMLKVKKAEEQKKLDLLQLEELVKIRNEELTNELNKRKKAQKKLKLSELKYIEIFNSTNEAIFIDDAVTGEIIDINAAMLKIYGYDSKEEVLKLKIEDLASGRDKYNMETAKEIIKKCINEGPQIFEWEAKRKDGTFFWAEISLKKVDILGQNRIIAVIRDITERRKANETMIMRDRIFTHSLDMLCITGFDGYFKILNPAWERTLGWSTEELMAKPWVEFVHPDDRNTAAGIKKDQNNGYFENRYICKDGSVKWLSWNSFPYPSEGIVYGVARDITEKKQVELNLLESENRFKAVSEYSHNAICIVNTEAKIIWANTALERLGGFPKEDIYNAESFLEFIAPESKEFIINNFMNFVAGKEYLKHYEFYFINSDGEKRLCEKYMTDFVDKAGNRSLVISMLDITEARRSQTIQKIQHNIANATIVTSGIEDIFKLVRSELNAIVDTTNFFIATYNEKNDLLTKVYSADEKDKFTEWIAEKSLTGIVIKKSESLVLSKNDIDILFRKKEIELVGSPAASWLGVPIKAGRNAIGAIVIQSYTDDNAYDENSKEVLEIIATQLSLYLERKKAQETAIKLLKGVEQSPVCTFITDIHGHIEYINPEFTKVTGYSENEITGKTPGILKSGHQNNDVYKEMWFTIKSKKEWTGELKNKKKNGEYYWVQVSISPILDDNGDICHFIALETDITDKKKILNDLVIAKEKAEEGDRLKTAFLNNMSHEIRTPLNGIVGFTSLLQNNGITDSDKENYFRIINKCSTQLTSIIDDIISISTIEAGQEKARESVVDIKSLMTDLYNLFSAKINRENVSLDYHNLLAEPETLVKTDEIKLTQVLNNLLVNAIKFTHKGNIDFACKREGDFLHFYVSDTGIGIDPKHHEIIFQRFRQETPNTSNKYGGNGLGLAISKAYVNLMGGKIWVESEPGTGSSFHFTISYKPVVLKPIETSKNNEVNFLEINTKKRYTILVAEDEWSNYTLIEAILSNYKFNLIHVTNGSLAVEEVRKNKNIDLILMDIKMPVMNGIEATTIIKSEKPHIPIIANTAYATNNDRRLALDAGCNDYISKPFNISDLLIKISDLL